jgi:hypothetical protein
MFSQTGILEDLIPEINPRPHTVNTNWQGFIPLFPFILRRVGIARLTNSFSFCSGVDSPSTSLEVPSGSWFILSNAF